MKPIFSKNILRFLSGKTPFGTAFVERERERERETRGERTIRRHELCRAFVFSIDPLANHYIRSVV